MGFEGNYNNFKKYYFEDIFLFSTGKNIKQSEASPEFEYPCIRYGELYHMYNEVVSKIINKTNLDKTELLFSKGDEILLPSAGEDPLDIGSASALTVSNVAIGRTINILRPKSELKYSSIFASYYINQQLKKKIASLAKGVSISNVYNSDLKKLEITLPNFEEQQRIALFLSLIDERIQTQIKIIEDYKLFKKGMMKKIFNQEIRFKDKQGVFYPEWKKKKLGEVLDYEQPTKFIVNSTEYENNYNTPVLTAGKSFILGFTNEEENIYKTLPVIIFDDFTMANKFVDFDFKVKSSAMKILKARNKTVNLKFVYECIQMIYYPKGDEHKRFWISEYSKIKIDYPSTEEQQKISSTLSSIDNKISLESEYLEKLKSQKKYLLQNLFI
ncbi:MAG: restriction endonuclease subunit S [Polaribacter sp.]|uniref:restriction endonuclease subunit S n=1 Tax=Polaribacter sp. TaxID=1920175 RepID=UPI002F35922D